MKKALSLRTLKGRLNKARASGKSIVFTNGCFDIIHSGHVRYLRKARTLGDLLVVGLNSDKSVRKIKGKKRPIVPESERAEILSAFEFVDFVVLFDDATPLKLIETLKPNVLVKGADWKRGEIVGEDAVRASGGRVARITLVKGKSTTNIVERVLKLNK